MYPRGTCFISLHQGSALPEIQKIDFSRTRGTAYASSEAVQTKAKDGFIWMAEKGWCSTQEGKVDPEEDSEKIWWQFEENWVPMRASFNQYPYSWGPKYMATDFSLIGSNDLNCKTNGHWTDICGKRGTDNGVAMQQCSVFWSRNCAAAYKCLGLEVFANGEN